MFYVFCSLLAAALAFIVLYKDVGIVSSLFSAISSGILAFILSIVFLLPYLNTYSTLKPDEQDIAYEDPIGIVALKDSFGVDGSAFLFSSTVNEKLKYNYLIETDFGIILESVDAEDCFIRYGNSPSIQKIRNMSKNGVINLLFLPGDEFYIITIPEDSVIKNVYEVDLE